VAAVSRAGLTLSGKQSGAVVVVVDLDHPQPTKDGVFGKETHRYSPAAASASVVKAGCTTAPRRIQSVI
jgi:hypothetical protein